MLSQGMPIQQAIGLLKQTYFDVAAAELGRAKKRASDSRLSLMTGIHRKELRRLKESSEGDADIPKSVSIGAQLVSQWIASPRFLDATSRPRPLRRASESRPLAADAPSFDELVASVSTDVHPRAVLDELLRLGVVRIDDQRDVHLLTAAFVPRKGFEEKVYYFGRNGHDHLEAAVRNIAGDSPPLLDRSVHYDNLSPADVDRLSEFAEQEGMKLLHAVNRLALELRAESPSDSTERMNFGLYFYRGPDAGSDEVRGAETDA